MPDERSDFYLQQRPGRAFLFPGLFLLLQADAQPVVIPNVFHLECAEDPQRTLHREEFGAAYPPINRRHVPLPTGFVSGLKSNTTSSLDGGIVSVALFATGHR